MVSNLISHIHSMNILVLSQARRRDEANSCLYYWLLSSNLRLIDSLTYELNDYVFSLNSAGTRLNAQKDVLVWDWSDSTDIIIA